MLCWVLGSLVLPTVSPLVPGVSAGEGVVASGFGVDGGAGVGVAVTGPGFRRDWFGVAGSGRSPLLAEGLPGLPLCPSGVSGGPAAPLAGGCWVLVLLVFVCCVRLWCGRCSRFGVWCAFVGLVSEAAVAVCVVCMRGRVLCVGGAFGCLSWPFWAWLGGSVWVLGLCVVAPLPSRLWGLGVVPRPPWLGFFGGVSPRRPLSVPSPLCLFAASLGAVFPCCFARAFPAVVGGGGGSLSSARVPFPWCFPFGGAMLALPVRV